MMVIKTFLLTIFVFLVFMPVTYANNLQLKNVNMASIDSAAQTMTLSFDLSQENSWRSTLGSTITYDAVWIFMKYSTDGGVTWNHASMAGNGINPAGYEIPTNFQIDVPSDQRGFFFHRSSFGSGNISLTGIKFVWNYAQDGLSTATAQAANTLHKVFGVEMVYIPTGAFNAGDGNSSANFHFKKAPADNSAWSIQNENGFDTTDSAGSGFYYVSTGATGESATGESFTIPPNFPKGYRDFYLMKYELTEGQWVSFFNTLSNAAKLNRDITSNDLGGKAHWGSGVVNRNTISWDSTHPSLPATTERPSRAVSYVSWPDVAAYAGWAGLRPVTELEFEKAARGVGITPVPDEFAWGTTNSVPALSISPDADENGSETANSGSNLSRNLLGYTTGDGRSALLGGIAENQAGPLRAGIFASNFNNRISSGAGFYGNMELSGNLAEPVVTIGRPEGRIFQGSHGTGRLSTVTGKEGNAIIPLNDWPGIDLSHPDEGVRYTIGIGYRGGDFNDSNIRAFEISDRTYAVQDPDSHSPRCFQRYDTICGQFYGGRLGRTAP